MRASHTLLASLAVVALAGSAVPAHVAAKSQVPPAAYLEPAVPFIENDYTRALAEARARKVPLFVEAWAPW